MYGYDPLTGMAAFNTAVANMADRDRQIAEQAFNAGYMQANADRDKAPDWETGFAEGRQEAAQDFAHREKVYFWMIGVLLVVSLALGGAVLQATQRVWHLLWSAKCPPIERVK